MTSVASENIEEMLRLSAEINNFKIALKTG